jgi:hypothetical protein
LVIVTANIVSSSPILASLIMDMIRSSKTSVLTTAKQRNIPEVGILQNTNDDKSNFIGKMKKYK